MFEARSIRNPISRRPCKVMVSIVTIWSFLFTTIYSDMALISLISSAGKAWAAESAVGPTSLGPIGTGSSGSFKELNVATFNMPENLGSIKDSFNGNGSEKVVIHIQDAHCNYDAQHKVSEIIEYLDNEYGVETVNLEGGARGYDLSIFTGIDDKAIRERTADYFVREGLVNGAEYFAINNPEKAALWGVEDTKLYVANLNVYRESLNYKDEVDKCLKSISCVLSNLKTKVYSEELFEFDAKYTQYKAGSLELKDYLTFLVQTAKNKAIDIKGFTSIYLLSQTLAEEGSIDFKKANSQRDELIDNLQKRLPKKMMEEMVVKTVEFKAEKISQKDFYAYLIKKANLTGIKLSEMPEFQKYIVYISMYDAIDKMKVMEELDKLESAIKETLYENDKQRELSTLSKNLSILKNIFNISLTKDDYQYYLGNSDSFNVSNYTSFISKEAPLSKITAQLDGNIANLDQRRESIAKFYEFSFKRDDAFLRNMRFDRKQKVAVMVTGGFHTENLCEIFKKKNIAYISIMPAFSNGEGYASPYFGLLKGDISDSSKIIYCALSGISASSMAVAALYTALGAEVWGQRNIDIMKAWVTLASIAERGGWNINEISKIDKAEDSLSLTLKDGVVKTVKIADLFHEDIVSERSTGTASNTAERNILGGGMSFAQLTDYAKKADTSAEALVSYLEATGLDQAHVIRDALVNDPTKLGTFEKLLAQSSPRAPPVAASPAFIDSLEAKGNLMPFTEVPEISGTDFAPPAIDNGVPGNGDAIGEVDAKEVNSTDGVRNTEDMREGDKRAEVDRILREYRDASELLVGLDKAIGKTGSERSDSISRSFFNKVIGILRSSNPLSRITDNNLIKKGMYIIAFREPGVARKSGSFGIKQRNDHTAFGYELNSSFIGLNRRILVELMAKEGLVSGREQVVYSTYKETVFAALPESSDLSKVKSVADNFMRLSSAILRSDKEALRGLESTISKDKELWNDIIKFMDLMNSRLDKNGYKDLFTSLPQGNIVELNYGASVVEGDSEEDLLRADINAQQAIAMSVFNKDSGLVFSMGSYKKYIEEMGRLRNELKGMDISGSIILDRSGYLILSEEAAKILRFKRSFDELTEGENGLFTGENIFKAARNYYDMIGIQDYINKGSVNFSDAARRATDARNCISELENKLKTQGDMVVVDDDIRNAMQAAKDFLETDTRAPDSTSALAFHARGPPMEDPGYITIDVKNMGGMNVRAFQIELQDIERAFSENNEAAVHEIWRKAAEDVTKDLLAKEKAVKNMVIEAAKEAGIDIGAIAGEGAVPALLGGDECTFLVPSSLITPQLLTRINRELGVRVAGTKAAPYLREKYLNRTYEVNGERKNFGLLLAHALSMLALDEGITNIKSNFEKKGVGYKVAIQEVVVDENTGSRDLKWNYYDSTSGEALNILNAWGYQPADGSARVGLDSAVAWAAVKRARAAIEAYKIGRSEDDVNAIARIVDGNPSIIAKLSVLVMPANTIEEASEIVGPIIAGYVKKIDKEAMLAEIRAAKTRADNNGIKKIGPASWSTFFDFLNKKRGAGVLSMPEIIKAYVVYALENGMSNIELPLDFLPFDTMTRLGGELSKEDLDAIRALLKEGGVTLSIHSPLVGPNVGGKTLFEDSLDNMSLVKEQIRIAGEMGAKNIVVHISDHENAAKYADLVIYAKENGNGIKIAFENYPNKNKEFPTAAQFMGSFEMIVESLKVQNRLDALSAMGICFDSAHFNLSGEDPVVSALIVANRLNDISGAYGVDTKAWLAELHLNQNIGPIKFFTGYSADIHANASKRGPINNPAIMAILRVSGYKDFIATLEQATVPTREDIDMIEGAMAKDMPAKYLANGKAMVDSLLKDPMAAYFIGGEGADTYNAYVNLAGIFGGQALLEHLNLRLFQEILSINSKSVYEKIMPFLPKGVTLKEFSAGVEVITQGSIVSDTRDADVFYMVVEGVVDGVVKGENGKEFTFSLGAGQFFGEGAYLKDGVRSATVKASKEGAAILAIDREVLLRMTSLMPSLLDLMKQHDEIRLRADAAGLAAAAGNVVRFPGGAGELTSGQINKSGTDSRMRELLTRVLDFVFRGPKIYLFVSGACPTDPDGQQMEEAAFRSPMTGLESSANRFNARHSLGMEVTPSMGLDKAKESIAAIKKLVEGGVGRQQIYYAISSSILNGLMETDATLRSYLENNVALEIYQDNIVNGKGKSVICPMPYGELMSQGLARLNIETLLEKKVDSSSPEFIEVMNLYAFTMSQVTNISEKDIIEFISKGIKESSAAEFFKKTFELTLPPIAAYDTQLIVDRFKATAEVLRSL